MGNSGQLHARRRLIGLAGLVAAALALTAGAAFANVSDRDGLW